MWFSIVGFVEDQRLPKKPEICSDHFDPKDFITRPNGSRYIKPGALPVGDPVFLEPLSYSSDSTDTSTPPPPQLKNMETTALVGTSDQTPVAGPSGCNKSPLMPTLYKKDSSSSVTETASEVDPEMLDDDKDNIDRAKPSKQKEKGFCKRKRGYIGDMTSSDFSTPEKRRKNLDIVKRTVIKQRKQIHNLQMSVRRLKKRVTTLKTLLQVLKKKSLISETSVSTINASLSGDAVDVFERLLKGPSTQKYTPSLRSFALTLSFYSPRAYNFVRNTFNRSLPHLGTISKWYRSVDGSPGFTKEALVALTLKQKESARPFLCNLVIDEMSIRRQVEWTGQKFTGYVDIGTRLDGDVLPEAREALVFMLVCLNASWKLPVGYFLLAGLSAIEKSGLIKKCLEFIHESGILVTSLTFDGAPANISMAEELGADFSNPWGLKTTFKHPVTNSDIYIYLDPCHMIKLIRNCLGSEKRIKNISGELISWEYLTKLVEKQKQEGLHAANKIKSRHLQWYREKMRVRLIDWQHKP